jgi:hypothetical protein
MCPLIFNKTGGEDPRAILDRLHDTKSALKIIIYCDGLRHIESMEESGLRVPLVPIHFFGINVNISTETS